MVTLYDSSRAFRPAVALTRLISRRRLVQLRHGGLLLCVGGALVAALAWRWPTLLPLLTPWGSVAAGVSALGLALWLDALLALCYHNSYYFRGLTSVIGLADQPYSGATYDVARAVLRNPEDIAEAFATSRYGRSALQRCGISTDAIATYLTQPRSCIAATMVPLPEHQAFSLIDLAQYLVTQDHALAELLRRHGVQPDTFLGAVRWLVGAYHQHKRDLRWWSRDNLSRTEGIGTELSYGIPHQLRRFSRDIRTSAVFSTLTRDRAFAAEAVAEIEATLARNQTNNVLLIGEAGVGKIDLVMEVARRMRSGEALRALVGTHVYVLDTTRLFAVHPDKTSLERAWLQLLSEAADAGHTIIVIENFSTVLAEAEALHVYLPELLDTYLGQRDVRLIITDTPAAYHTNLETRGAFVRRFTDILIDTPTTAATTRVLEKIALREEQSHPFIITYPAVVAAAEAADRYIVDGVMPDKAVTLLLRVTSQAAQRSLPVVTADFVYEIVSDHTGIPAGPIADDERQQLLHLEDRLRTLVVGQDQALIAIARTLRRARAGIQAADKPLGSFLFLGPTGVGKTETAKALATIFFDGEHNLRRLDMSEYSGVDAVDRLIGTPDSSGSLPSLLREHPYSVLLLDEFEKASQAVHDIFLQVLDEGVFTDGRGQATNARNCIIIATSNAGSRLIQQTVQSRRTLTHLNEEIISHIIAEGVYRPELINRFDSTIIFEPLATSEQTQVARLLLERLTTRVQEQGYELHLDPSLIEVVATHGYDPEFGARPMQRVIQDGLEAAIARHIIAAGVKKGGRITLTRAQVEPLLTQQAG